MIMTTLTANFDNVKAHAPSVLYTFPNVNKKDETITVDMHAYEEKGIDYIYVQVHVQKDNKCYESYNPTVKIIKHLDNYGKKSYKLILNPEWQLENTADNKIGRAHV